MVRPVRVGLLVEEGSVEDFSRAVELASIAWGGLASPIIPVSSESPAAALRYAEELDVDVLAAVTSKPTLKELAKTTGYSWRSVDDRGPFGRGDETLKDWVLGLDALLAGEEARRTAAPGGLLHVTWAERHPLNLFCLALFGRFGDERHEREIQESFLANAQTMDLQDSAPLPAFAPARAPIRLGASGLFRDPRRPTVLVGDPSSLNHLTTFWNYRALGDDVMAWPIGHGDLVLSAATSWITNLPHPAWLRLGNNEKVIEIVADTDSIPADLQEFLNANLPPDVGTFVSRIGLPVPWHRERPIVSTTYSRSFRVETSLGNLSPAVGMPALDFLPKRFWYERMGTVAADVSITTEWQLPPGWRPTAPALRSFGHWIRNEMPTLWPFARTTGEGIVVGADATEDEIQLPMIPSLGLVNQLFKSKGFTCQVSDTGRYSARLIEILGGAFTDSAANQPAIREVLNKAAQSEFGQPPQALIQLANYSKGVWDEPRYSLRRPGAYGTSVVEWLTKQKALRPRLKLQCLACGSDASLPPESLQAEIRCELCDEVYPLALALARKRRPWLLATASVLPVQRLNETYPVMAAISAFASLRGPGAYLPHHVIGLELTKEPFRCEIDIALLFQNVEQPALVICEAKSFRSELDQDDFDKLTTVQNAARDAGIDCYLLVATMRDSLTPFEVQELRRICESAPHAITPSGRTTDLIFPIVLTSRNLSVPSMHDDHPQKLARGWGTLTDLAKKTCEVHLGMTGIRMERLPEDGGSVAVPRWAST